MGFGHYNKRGRATIEMTMRRLRWLLPVAIIAWFVFIRPTHRERYRKAIADLPRWDLRADGPAR